MQPVFGTLTLGGEPETPRDSSVQAEPGVLLRALNAAGSQEEQV